MKIRLSAFGEKLVGYMEVPENTTATFDLVLLQPIQVFTKNYKDYPLMDNPLQARCTFEWTGMVEMFDDGKRGRGARIYVLTKMDKI